MLNTILVLLMVLFPMPPIGLPQTTAEDASGQVTGCVYDPSEAVFAGTTVVLRGAGIERKVKTNEDGIYRAELPAGLYQISLEHPELKPYRRAPFRVRAGESVMINLAPAISSIPMSVLYVGPPEKAPHFPPDKPLKYDSFRVAGPMDQPREMLIEYGQRRYHRDSVEYMWATLSYDALLVFGKRLRYDKKRSVIEAEGDVILEHGHERQRVKRVILKLRDGAPEVESVERL
jgi:hypothetical protein